MNQQIINLSNEVSKLIKPQFEKIDEIVEYNQVKVIRAMQKYQLSEAHFFGTSGYGYDDIGREVIEKIYADIFGVEDALVRIQLVSGTHALSTMLFGLLRPNDELVAITGKPYDTLDDAIAGEGIGSLKDYGVKYTIIDLLEDGKVDIDKVLEYVKANNITEITSNNNEILN